MKETLLADRDFRMIKTDISPDEIRNLSRKVDLILEAITLAHQKGPDGKCREDCWSCKVLGMMEEIKVARNLRSPEKSE